MKTHRIYPTEHQIQSAFFKELDYKHAFLVPYFPGITVALAAEKLKKSIFAVPNGGLRNVLTAVNLKREGVKAGVFDVFCAIPSHGKHGLWIEFKKPGGILTVMQSMFQREMTNNGYKCIICFSSKQAIDELEEYLKNG